MASPFFSFDPFFGKVDFLFFFSLFLFLLFPLSPVFMKMKEKVFSLFPSLFFFGKGTWEILFPVFFFLSSLNVLTLWGFLFSPLPHLLFTFSVGMCFWLGIFFLQLFFFFFRKCAHCVPPSTPPFLLSLMVFIEIISQLIRPITLSVRLAANLTAGHLILSLLSSGGLFISLFQQIPLFFLEFLVAFVQPFVFCMLLFLYFSEN